MEHLDATALNNFNQDKNFFKKITYNKEGARIDVMAIDIKDRKCHVEMKQRTDEYADFNSFIKKYDTIYIDCGKLDFLSDVMQASGFNLNEQELFVSIFNDGDIILIHNLNKQQPVLWMPNRRVWNPAKNRHEREHKIGLYWYYATIYEKNEDGHYEKWSDDKIRANLHLKSSL